MKTLVLFFIISFSYQSFAQERLLLHIGNNGEQEAIPLKKGQRAQDVIERLENAKSSFLVPGKPAGMVDTVKYYPGYASGENILSSNFGFTHQDVALQWYIPLSGGEVKEIWWRNYEKGGNIRKASIRAWLVDPKLATRPATVQTKHLGFYKDPNDGDGGVTPFKPIIGDQWFYGNGGADSATWNFDPLGTEAPWLPNGMQVTLDSNKWQGLRLTDWGEKFSLQAGQPFGFTIANDTKISDIPGVTDERMEILSWPNQNSAPYHSFKWYEQGRTPGVDKGWHMRGDYEWGMYVVIEYVEIPHPRFILGNYGTTLNPGPRKICVTINDDNPGGGPSPFTAYLFYRFGGMAKHDSVQMIPAGIVYCAEIPRAHVGDTVYWYINITDVNGNHTKSTMRFYKIFQRTQDRLFIYNNTQYGLSIGNLIYTGSLPKYDCWSAPNDGISELADLLALYDKVLVADGSFPSRNVYPSLNAWLAAGTAAAKKNLFYSSQDYGCYIQEKCADTTFPVGSFEEKYLGISTLGPQDQGPTNRPIKFIPQADTVTNYLIKYNVDSSTALWYYPSFELAFSAYPDFMTPTASAKPLFKDATGENVFGVRNSGATFNTVFLAFDAGALQFRSDTSLHNSGYTTITDPKYRWIADVKSLSNSFFDEFTDVRKTGENIPLMYSLSQNYPNPFNPATTIDYEIPFREQVQIVLYNALGQRVATVVNERKEAGAHTATFNAYSLASGLYFCEMRAGNFVSVKKMVLMK
jgi:hypothetical protein